jgi:hypothetical protein
MPLEGIFFEKLFIENGGYSVLVIDLQKKKTQLNETWDEALGWWTKELLKYMYGDDVKMRANLNEEDEEGSKFTIIGEYEDVKSYSTAVVKQKEYLDAYTKFGPGHPQEIKAKNALNDATEEFEQITGMRWPFTTGD